MSERIAIINGLRTPFCKAGTSLAALQADDLGAIVVRELLHRTEIDQNLIDEVIFGNVGQPVTAMNIARVIALKAGLPNSVPAFTVHRNCASGMESITTAMDKILAGNSEIIISGGCESMSNYPLIFSKKMTDLFSSLFQSKSAADRLKALTRFRPDFLKPTISLIVGLTDPVCGLSMGQTAEVLSREFHITREDQDTFALRSHHRAEHAQEQGHLEEEILPIALPPEYKKTQFHDNGVRKGQTIEALAKLKPYFDKVTGSVTVGNACQVTDGAGAFILMKESKAKELDLPPLGYIKHYAYAGLEPNRMGLGPVYSSALALDKAGMTIKDIDRIEMNEAFAAQVIANEKAFASDSFAENHLNRSKALGEIDPEKLNVNGGAIALGHPVGATGSRIVLTLLKELRRNNLQTGLATLCIGGGQGGALIVEVD